MFGSLNNNDLQSHNVRKIGPKCTVLEGLEGIALLEGSMSQRVGCETSKAQGSLAVSFCLLPLYQNVKLSVTVLATCLLACCHDDHGQSLLTYNQGSS